MASSPSTSLATLRPELAGTFEEFDLEMDRMKFIGHKLLPVIEVDVAAGKFAKVKIEDLLRTRDTRRAPGAGYSKQNAKFTYDSWVTSENGAEEDVDENEAAMYAEYIDAEYFASKRAKDVVLRNQEQRVSDLLCDATAFASQLTNLTHEWDDFANADPVAEVEAMIQDIYDRTGLWPNAIAFNQKIFRNLRQCESILDRIKYSGRDGVKTSEINASMLAQLFDLEHVLVGGSSQNTASPGQDAELSSIWPDEYAVITRIAEDNDIRTPCVGRTFHWGKDGSTILGTVESYRDEARRADVMRCRHQTQEKLLFTELVHLVGNVTT